MDRSRIMSRATAATVLLFLLGAGKPTAAEGQVAELLKAVSDGGSWVNFDIIEGRGSYRSLTIPTAGMSFDGCFQIWEGHSGTWTVQAQEPVGGGELQATARPGEPVEFEYQAGLQARLEVAIEWSEPRDTTLFVWVGLDALTGQSRDSCQPPEG